MKIVTLGHDAVGKTTYIATMYGLMRSGYRGFQVRTTDEEQDRDLAASARDILSGRYPPATPCRTDYSFELTYRGRRITGFSLADYRGGVLLERSGGPDSDALRADLHWADALVVLFDATLLADSMIHRRQVRRLHQLTELVVARSLTIPVVLAFTKADLVAEAGGWSCAATPIRALADGIGALGTTGVTVAMSCGPIPQGVHVPLLWSVSQHLSAQAAELSAEVERSRRLGADAGIGAGLWNNPVGPADSTADGTVGEYGRPAREAQHAREGSGEPAGKMAGALRAAWGSSVRSGGEPR